MIDAEELVVVEAAMEESWRFMRIVVVETAIQYSRCNFVIDHREICERALGNEPKENYDSVSTLL